MNDIVIEKANVKDVLYVYNNIKKCADDMAIQGLCHWIPYYAEENILEDIQNGKTYLVKNEAQQVIGSFNITLNEENESFYLGKLAIIPECSGKGIGTKCLEFIEKLAKDKGLKKIELDVYEKSLRVINFYKKNGYVIVGQKPTRRFIVLLMEKVWG